MMAEQKEHVKRLVSWCISLMSVRSFRKGLCVYTTECAGGQRVDFSSEFFALVSSHLSTASPYLRKSIAQVTIHGKTSWGGAFVPVAGLCASNPL